ncbi:hypothetical protein QUT90_22480, partial [Xanthomonas citri pv. citri]
VLDNVQDAFGTLETSLAAELKICSLYTLLLCEPDPRVETTVLNLYRRQTDGRKFIEQLPFRKFAVLDERFDLFVADPDLRVAAIDLWFANI